MSQKSRSALLVLGMHRSGTSALTRVLGLCGATLPRHLMEPSVENAHGYFESIPIYQLHEEMLEAFGLSWYDLSPMPEGWANSAMAATFVDRMVDVVREEFGDSRLFVVKDPRLCLLVPFWLKVLARIDVDPRFLIPVRNPLEVSASLERAQGVDEQHGRLLWLQHLLLAERDTRDRIRSIVSYDQLLDEWRAVVDRVSSELGLILPRRTRRAEAEIDDFLTAALRHHEIPTKSVEARSDVGQWVKKAYSWAERAARGRAPSFRTFDAVANAFFTAEEAFGPVVATSEHRRLKETEAASRLREEKERGEERSAADSQAEQRLGIAETQLQERDVEISQLRRDVEQLGDLEVRLAQSDTELIRLQERTARQETIEAQLKERDTELGSLREKAMRLGIAEMQLQERDVEITRLRGANEGMTDLRIRLAQREIEITRLREDSAMLDVISSQLSERDTELDLLRVTVEESSATLDRLTNERDDLATKVAEIPKFEQEILRREIELKGLRKDVLQIARLRQRLVESEAARERVEEEAEDTYQEKTAGLRAALEEREVELVQLRRRRTHPSDDKNRDQPDHRDPGTDDLPDTDTAAESESGDPILPGPLFEPAPGTIATTRRSHQIALMPRRAAKLAYRVVTFQLGALLRERRTVRRIREIGLFDDHYYRAQAQDVANDGGDPIAHYLRHGAEEGRNPSASFDTRYYLEHNPDVLEAGLNPLDHFAFHGWQEGRSPHPHFDVNYYLSVNSDVAASGENPLHHWLYSGRGEGRATTQAQAESTETGSASWPSSSSPSSDRSSSEPSPAPIQQIQAAEPEPAILTDEPPIYISLETLDVFVDRIADPDDPVVVVVTHEIPYPPRAGNQYRISRYIDWLLKRGYQVITVFSPLPGATPPGSEIQQAAQILENLVVCHRDGRIQSNVAPHLAPLLLGLKGRVAEPFDPDPERFEGEQENEYRDRLVLERTFCPDVLVHSLLHIDQGLEGPSAFITSYAFVTRYLSQLRPDTLTLIDTHDVFSSKAKKIDAFGVVGELRLTEIQERALLERGHVTMAIQAEEAREFERLMPDRPVLTIGVDFDCAAESAAPLPELDVPPTLALVASDNAMNVKGLNDFLRHCWPLLRRDDPEVRLRVAGSIGESIPKECPGVEVLGRIDSLGEFYQSCHVAINPAPAGTGLKIKTVEAIAHYRRIVTWSLGVDGVPEPLLRFCGVAEDWYEFYLELSKALSVARGEPAFNPEDRALVRETLSSGNVYRLLGDTIDLHCRIAHSDRQQA